MSTPDLFVAGLRLQLAEAQTIPQTFRQSGMPNPQQRGIMLDVVLPEMRTTRVWLMTPKKGQPGECAVSIRAAEREEVTINATPADMLFLADVVAALLTNPTSLRDFTPPAGDTATDAERLYVTQAVAELDPRRYRGTRRLPAELLNRHPRTADLFDDSDFWWMCLAFRSSRWCSVTAGGLADLVQKRGFDRLAQLLRVEPEEALRTLPTKSVCPSCFTRRVPELG